MTTPHFKPGDAVQVTPNCTKFFETDGNRVFYQSLGKGTVLQVITVNSMLYTWITYKVEFTVGPQRTVYEDFRETDLMPYEPPVPVNKYECCNLGPKQILIMQWDDAIQKKIDDPETDWRFVVSFTLNSNNDPVVTVLKEYV